MDLNFKFGFRRSKSPKKSRSNDEVEDSTTNSNSNSGKPKQIVAARLKSICDELLTLKVPPFVLFLTMFEIFADGENAGSTFSAKDVERFSELFDFNLLSPETIEKCREFGGSVDRLLSSNTVSVNKAENVELLNFYMAGGKTVEEFDETVRKFDNATTCGLVWTPNFVAYRCRTCGHTPCMSLCADCFHGGTHDGHDFNMFRSQAGGACDCGDTSVMQESGFCKRHGPNAHKNVSSAPPDLLSVASFMLPKVFRRILEHFRVEFHGITSGDGNVLSVFEIVDHFGQVVDLVQNFANLGAAAHSVITRVLTCPDIYKVANEAGYDVKSPGVSPSYIYLKEAVKTLPSVCTKEDSDSLECPALSRRLKHSTMLEELMFWLVRLDFPQKLVTLLLTMLPNEQYKYALADSFVMHYSRMAFRIARQEEKELLANRVIHISVQLLSNENLAAELVTKHRLNLVIVASLYSMMKETLIHSDFHCKEQNTHLVANCTAQALDNHSYWSLVSDLHNVLNHKHLSIRFLRDPMVVDMWCNFLMCFQGMNVNIREMGFHVEFESRTYFASFTAELEACSTTLWNLVASCAEKEYQDCVLLMLQRLQTSLVDWFQAVKFVPPSCWKPHPLELSFHFPLHRFYAAFLCIAAQAEIDVPCPSQLFIRQCIMHPLQIQVARSEISAGMWVRNGPTLRYQSCLYVQNHFCCAFHDMDLALIQASAARVSPDWLVLTIFERFHLVRWLSFAPSEPLKPYLRPEWRTSMLEGALRLIVGILTQRMNTGMSELENTRLEIGTMLAIGDKTHSQLVENLPEKGIGNSSSHKHFEQVLNELSDYKEPNLEAGGGMSQGMYTPKDVVWEKYFDPLLVISRAIQPKEYQSAMDRYKEHLSKSEKSKHPGIWAPFRLPRQSDLREMFKPLLGILHCRSLHAMLYAILYKALQQNSVVSEHALGLAVFVLELAFSIPFEELEAPKSERRTVVDSQFSTWFTGDSAIRNLAQRIDRILCFQYSPGLVRALEEKTDLPGFPDLYRMQLKDQSDGINDLSLSLRVEGAGSLPYIDSTPDNEAALVPSDKAYKLDKALTRALAPLPAALRQECLTCIPKLALEAASREPYHGTMELTLFQNDSAMDVTEKEEEDSEPIVTEESSENSDLEEQRSENDEAEKQKGLPSPRRKKALPSSRPGPKALPHPEVHIHETGGESMISMLIKLYEKFNGGETFKPAGNWDFGKYVAAERTGTGAFFMRNVLNLAYNAESGTDDCRVEIDRILAQKKPKEGERKDGEKTVEDAREARKRLARERQQRLMSQFMSKQKEVMQQLIEKEGEGMDIHHQGTSGSKGKEEKSDNLLKIEEIEIDDSTTELQCVICNQCSTPTSEEPIGLVVCCQANSVLGKEMPEGGRAIELMKAAPHGEMVVNRGYLSKKYLSQMVNLFDQISTLHSVNIGWEGGVRVKTCGHYIHTDCHNSYIQALQNDRTQMVALQVEKGEFFCPLCRQLSNQVLPIARTEPPRSSLTSFTGYNSWEALMAEITNRLATTTKEPICERKSRLEDSMEKFLEKCRSSTYPMFARPMDSKETPEDPIVMLKSVLRTNLEIDMMTRKLHLEDLERSQKSCQGELLLAISHAVRTSEGSDAVAQLLWSELAGTQQPRSDRLASGSVMDPAARVVITVLRDPGAVLIHLVAMLCPRGTWDEGFKGIYQGICQCLLNLQYVRACLQYITFVPEEQLKVWDTWFSTESLDTLSGSEMSPQKTLSWITKQWRSVKIDWDEMLGPSRRDKLKDPELRWFFWEKELENSCLEFLQLASQLQNAMTDPAMRRKEMSTEFGELYRELTDCIPPVTESDGVAKECFLRWPPGGEWIAKRWVGELLGLIQEKDLVKSKDPKIFRLLIFPMEWRASQLLRLPENYESLFQGFLLAKCSRCQKTPKDSLICMFCGQLVCGKDTCCLRHRITEPEMHSMQCGAGTGIFISVQSSMISVIRDKRICHQWVSLYLDSHGEEDRNLKRGKPLYLSRERFELLEKQWQCGVLDSACKRWTWLHPNFLDPQVIPL